MARLIHGIGEGAVFSRLERCIRTVSEQKNFMTVFDVIFRRLTKVHDIVKVYMNGFHLTLRKVTSTVLRNVPKA